MLRFWMLFAYVTHGYAFYHTLSSTTFSVDSGKNSYFGYSIAYEPYTKWLIVSAPLTDILGKIYACDIDTVSCKPLDVNSTHSGLKNEMVKQHRWLGAVVKAAPSYFVTCAPLTVEFNYHFNMLFTNGECFKYSTNNNSVQTLIPIPETRRYPHHLTEIHEFANTMDTFGLTVAIGEDDFIGIGGPAMTSGRFKVYYDLNKNPKDVNGSVADIKQNFGFSAAAGKFIKNTDAFAVGSTYGHYGEGEVVIMTRKLKKMFRVAKGEDDTVVGSMYGAALCAASLTLYRWNGKTGHKSDLLVGAPAYSPGNSVNRGAVYIYTNPRVKRDDIPVFVKKILGEKDDSYFGSALISVGDFNNDKLDEIAIAAPYEEDGRGTVYIYSGSDLNSIGDVNYLQKIEPRDSTWKSFGLSLSVLEDYDNNGCNELAIGVPQSAKVSLLRCMANVIVKIESKTPNLQVYPYKEEKGFLFQSCLNVHYPEKLTDVKASIEMIVEISHPFAKLRDSSQGSYVVYLNDRKNQYCRNISVYMPDDGVFDTPIRIKILGYQQNSPMLDSSFDRSRVILSNKSVLRHSSLVWACSGKCKSELKLLSATICGDSNCNQTYIIGSTSDIRVNVSVKNFGDIAHEACVQVRVQGAPVAGIPSSCEVIDIMNSNIEETVVLECTPKQVIRTNSVWSTDIIYLDAKRLTNKNEIITVDGLIYNRCRDETDVKNFNRSITLYPVIDGINVKGSTELGDDVVKLSATDILDLEKTFDQIYTISHIGPTSWVDLIGIVRIDKTPSVIVHQVMVQVEGSNSECNLNVEDPLSYVYWCDIAELTKNKLVLVIVTMKGLPELYQTLSKNNETVYSDFALHFDTRIISAEVTSTLQLIQAKVAIWIIVVTVFVGLFISSVIVYLLKRYGFLERKNKEKLRNMRKSVKRQTIMRQSMNTRTEPLLESDINQAVNRKKKDKRLRIDDNLLD